MYANLKARCPYCDVEMTRTEVDQGYYAFQCDNYNCPKQHSVILPLVSKHISQEDLDEKYRLKKQKLDKK